MEQPLQNSPQPVDEAILRFVGRHHVLVLATTGPEGVWCADCFYAYDRQRNAFVFTSDPATRHGSDLAQRPDVAASIVLETRIVGRVQGLQLTGRAVPGDDRARRIYLKRFPYAAVADLHLWQLLPDRMKLTDNTLGFGKKLLWKR